MPDTIPALVHDRVVEENVALRKQLAEAQQAQWLAEADRTEAWKLIERTDYMLNSALNTAKNLKVERDTLQRLLRDRA